MNVTIQTLRDLDACRVQTRLFSRLYPNGVEFSGQAASLAWSQGLDVPWFIKEAELSVTIKKEGREEYWVDGKRRREDGPAIVDGAYEEYRFNGKLHRKGGPAIETAMLYPLLAMIVGFTFLFGALLLSRVRSEVLYRERRARWVRNLVLPAEGTA